MKTTEQRKLTILNTALNLVRNLGFESVSIASLAKEVGMSKSGLFAHFNSKEKMHLMILDHAAHTFSEAVFRKALAEKRGLPRLRAIVNNWIQWYKEDGGGTCPFIAAAIEYDSRPGPVKERIQLHTSRLLKSLQRAVDICAEEGHLSSNNQSEQITFELYSLILGHLIYLRTIEVKSATSLFNQSFENLISHYQRP